jgi:hypothetical protein
MSMGQNPYAPGTPGMAPGGVAPPDLAKKAGNMQLMGILSIVLGFCCCPLIGFVLGGIVLAQAGGVAASLQQYGSPPDLMGKVNTGKICAIIGLVVSGVMVVVNIFVAIAQNQ